MIKIKFFACAILAAGIINTSCKKDENKDKAPELPPYESMAFDFNAFTGSNSDTITNYSAKSKASANTYINFTYSVVNVAVWNTILTGILAVPVASFYSAITQDPIYLGEATWQWTYSLSAGGNTYTAKLLGIVRKDDVKWEMYISRTGSFAFNDFMWFEGTSTLDGHSGQWILYYSPLNAVKFIQIDWVRSVDGIGEIKYTNIRQLNDLGTANVNYGTYIQAGYTTGDYDAYYNIHAYDTRTTMDFYDVNIEWNKTDKYGRVKSPLFYTDNSWHCWDNLGIDTNCE